jgi:hypothetical protein
VSQNLRYAWICVCDPFYSNFRFVGCHLYFQLEAKITSGAIIHKATELLDIEEMGLAVELPLLLHLELDIKLFPFAQPPSWISDFRLRRMVFPIFPMNCWTPKMGW